MNRALGWGHLSCQAGSPLTRTVTLDGHCVPWASVTVFHGLQSLSPGLQSLSSMGFSVLICQIWGLGWVTSKIALAPNPLKFYSTCHFYDVLFYMR